MKFKSIIAAVLLVGFMFSFSGCFDIVKTDVDTEQELLKILGESEESSSDEYSNDAVVYFDNAPDKFLEVVKDEPSVEKDSEKIDTANEETQNTNNIYIAEETDRNYNADNSEAKNENSLTSDNPSHETIDTVAADSLISNSRAENESAGTPVSENSGGNTNSESNYSESSVSSNSNQITYVLNTNTKKFHYKSCGSASQIKPKNYAEATGRDSIIASGYQPCKRCNP